ncbi:hypothetical protein RQW99_07475 [Leuconostoc falkenbergense]|uniref:hypothetical protein n=1 Tax=Leuconostoc falkenbergense TaxID=2766470 RepID=UPI002A7EC0B0|nr:hypothetical protein [Leuconostoc falkenbergense]MDY5164371.1 hypothetical protein [Leuconostoc falkenbergense]
MTEPVAYRVDGTIYNNINDAEFAVRETEHLRKYLGIDNGLIKKPVYIELLYTAEQLHPRIKMTQGEFDKFKNIKQENNLLSDALNSTAFFGNEKQQSEKQIEFANLFINLDLDNPEETIEIVPETKWFVRSKEPEDEDEYYLFLSGSNLDDLDYFGFDYAKPFDTKEEAEKWTNPLTEAVQLPVEEE